MSPELTDRFVIAEKITASKERVAETVTAALYPRHPEWLVRYGERGRSVCTEDIRFHLSFLAGAIEAGSPEAFADYASWVSRMLASRSISAASVGESFTEMATALRPLLSASELQQAVAVLERGVQACTQPVATQEQEPQTELRATQKVFLAAILNGDRKAALNIATGALRAGHAPVDIYVDVLAEALHEIGRLWELNRISVAQEHIATAVTQYVTANLYVQSAPEVPTRGNMVVTGVAGELHQIGANLVADAMESKGWNVRFFGSNAPQRDVLLGILDSSASVLCVSTTLVANLPATAQLIRSVRKQSGEGKLRIIVGGAAYGHCFDLDAVLEGPVEVMNLRSALLALCS